MKRILFLTVLSMSLVAASCGSDDKDDSSGSKSSYDEQAPLSEQLIGTWVRMDLQFEGADSETAAMVDQMRQAARGSMAIDFKSDGTYSSLEEMMQEKRASGTWRLDENLLYLSENGEEGSPVEILGIVSREGETVMDLGIESNGTTIVMIFHKQ